MARVVKDHSPIVAPERLSGSTASLEEIRSAGGLWRPCSPLGRWRRSRPVGCSQGDRSRRPIRYPDVFAPILANADGQGEEGESVPADPEDDKNPAIDAWREALAASFSQFEAYSKYISDRSPFGTHQGIKGLQFPRVLVILDDDEARGFMFSYEKLLGAKALTDTDHKNRLDGKDTSVDKPVACFT